MLSFVVQEHHSKKLHWDFRLEAGGVLKSWAVPKGPSLDPAQKRLAVQVADHDLDYRDFEGVIPAGYGAGRVLIWDSGPYKALEPASLEEGLGKGAFTFQLYGDILQGAFVLVKMHGPGREHSWLLIKKDDAFARPGWKTPVFLSPLKVA